MCNSSLHSILTHLRLSHIFTCSLIVSTISFSLISSSLPDTFPQTFFFIFSPLHRLITASKSAPPPKKTTFGSRQGNLVIIYHVYQHPIQQLPRPPPSYSTSHELAQRSCQSPSVPLRSGTQRFHLNGVDYRQPKRCSAIHHPRRLP